MKKYNIVFLDFDGVLNNERHFRERPHLYPECLYCDNVEAFLRVNARLSPEVIISSAWRLFYTVPELQQIFHKHGLSAKIKGATS